MKTWRHGGMETWRHGGMEAWRHGGMTQESSELVNRDALI